MDFYIEAMRFIWEGLYSGFNLYSSDNEHCQEISVKGITYYALIISQVIFRNINENKLIWLNFF